MSDDRLDYETFVADALRGVVRRALGFVARRGLPGEHHFYITIRTDLPEVGLPDRLRAQFPERMTLVLQHQFSGLSVDERRFGVTLTFGGKPERLSVPFEAVLAFVDPSVNFGLPIPTKEPPKAAPDAAKPVVDAPAGEAAASPASISPAGVVRLDQFRKK